MTAALWTNTPYPAFGLLSEVRRGHRWLWRSTLALAAILVVTLVLQQVDLRLLNGVSVWDKPAKFSLSLGLQLATVNWAIMQLPHDRRHDRSINLAAIIMQLCLWFEMAYMIFRAARGEASHFNVATPFAQFMYSAMGIGALGITGSAAFVGFKLWRVRKSGIMTEAAAVGLIVGMILGTVAGAHMGAQTSHWVGGDHSDAGGIGLFGWSTTGGDLRVAHFIGLHAAQIIPFAALSGRRSIVYATAAIVSLATVATLAMGIAGIPLLRA